MKIYRPISIILLLILGLTVGCEGIFTDLDDLEPDASNVDLDAETTPDADTSPDETDADAGPKPPECHELRELENYTHGNAISFEPSESTTLYVNEPFSMEFGIQTLTPNLSGTSSTRGIEVVSREEGGCISISEASCRYEPLDASQTTYRNSHGSIAQPGHYCIYFTTRDADNGQRYYHAFYEIELGERPNGTPQQCDQLPDCSPTPSTCCLAAQCSESNPICS